MLSGNSIIRDKAIRRSAKVAGCIIILLNLSFSGVLAQRSREDPPPFRERLFYGGSFGLSLGTYTDIEVAPVAGLWILPRLNFALGPKYRYQKYYQEKANMYGGKVYTQFMFIKDLNNMVPLNVHLGFFLHAEDEFFRYEYTDGVNTIDHFINTPLLGAGISEPIGRRASINIMFLFALDDLYGLYGDPEFRFSFIF